MKEKQNLNIFLFFVITGPYLPYPIAYGAMAESPDGKGVLLFGGYNSDTFMINILELRAEGNWTITIDTMQKGRWDHIVIRIP